MINEENQCIPPSLSYQYLILQINQLITSHLNEEGTPTLRLQGNVTPQK